MAHFLGLEHHRDLYFRITLPPWNMDLIERLMRLGQCIWLDSIASPAQLTADTVSHLSDQGFAGIADCHTLSVASIRDESHYDQAIMDITSANRSVDASSIHEILLLQDVAFLADTLLPEFTNSRHTRGVVSLPLIPYQFEEPHEVRECVHRLVRRLNRTNIVIKMPAMPVYLEALEELLADNISVYVSGMMEKSAFLQVQEAYLAALERRVQKQRAVDNLRCMAGLSIASIDRLVDSLLDEILAEEANPARQLELEGLKGRAGIATARLLASGAAQRTRGPKWNALQQHRANPITLIWEDLYDTQVCSPQAYCNQLIGPNTIAVLTQDRLSEVLNELTPSLSLFQGYSQVNTLLADITRLGFDFAQEVSVLNRQSTEQAHDHYLGILEVIAEKRVATTLRA